MLTQLRPVFFTQLRLRFRAALVLSCLIAGCLALSACGKSTQGSHKAGNAARSATNSAASQSASAGEAPVPTGELTEGPGLPPNTVVASVRGLTVTLAELLHRAGTMSPGKEEVPEPPDYAACVARLAAGTAGQSPAALKKVCQGRHEELLRTALNLLIRARWLTLQAREDGLQVDEAALDRELAKGLKVLAKIGQTLASTGRSLADTKYWGRIDRLSFMIYDRITRSTPPATPHRVAAYYKAHKQSFALMERRDLHLIRTDSRAGARTVLGGLRSGRSFASVVKEVSSHQPIHTSDGLILGLTHESYSEPALADAIFRAKPGVLSGPIRLYAKNSPKIAFGYYVFEITRIHPARQESLAQVRAAIARHLPELLRAQTLKRYVATFRKRWRARSNCRAGFVVEDCRQYKRKLPFHDPYTL